MTGLGAVAVQVIIAIRVVDDVVARVRAFVARVIRTGYAIVTVQRRPRLAAERRVTGFDPVTVQVIIAVRVVGDVVARIGAFVARIVRAGHTVIAIGRRSGHAAPTDTVFGAVAPQAVIAIGRRGASRPDKLQRADGIDATVAIPTIESCRSHVDRAVTDGLTYLSRRQ